MACACELCVWVPPTRSMTIHAYAGNLAEAGWTLGTQDVTDCPQYAWAIDTAGTCQAAVSGLGLDNCSPFDDNSDSKMSKCYKDNANNCGGWNSNQWPMMPAGTPLCKRSAYRIETQAGGADCSVGSPITDWGTCWQAQASLKRPCQPFDLDSSSGDWQPAGCYYSYDNDCIGYNSAGQPSMPYGSRVCTAGGKSKQ